MNKKSLIISSIIGFLAALVVIGLIWWNETIAVSFSRQISDITKSSHEVNPENVDASNDGKLIYLNGNLNYGETSDYLFDVTINTSKIKRVVEKYQYQEIKEVNEDGSIKYKYEGVWSPTYINSNKFYNSNYKNTSDMPYESETFYAEDLALGGYKLSDSLKEQIKATEVYTELDPIIAQVYDLKINGNYYTNSIDINAPMIGDIRISFLYSNSKEVSILSKQRLLSFEPFSYYKQNDKSVTYNKLINDRVNKSYIIKSIYSDNDLLRYELRFSLLFLLFIILFIFFRPFIDLVESFPFIGPIKKKLLSILVLFITIFIFGLELGLVWLIVKPIVSIMCLIIILASAFAFYIVGKKNYEMNKQEELILFNPELVTEIKTKTEDNKEEVKFVIEEEEIVKKEGIFLPIFSLPNKYGIGDFGKSAYEFVDLLASYKLSYWQILPIYPINENNNPYSPVSTKAINPLYIGIDILNEWGLLNEDYDLEIKDHVNYDEVKKYKYAFLKRSYIKFVNSGIFKEEYDNFVKTCDSEYPKYAHMKYSEEIEYQYYLQFLAYKQWMKLKEYANDKGIMIIGDVPMYVDQASSDVFFHTKDFLITNGHMEYVGGVEKGIYNLNNEVWEQPLYNFNSMKESKYEYLLGKYKYALSLFDLVRIDNFSAYSSFFKIPYGLDTSKGVYESGLGKEFLNVLFNKYSPSKFIVDDLYNHNEEVRKLRDFYGLSGTKILSYTFSFDKKDDLLFESKKMSVYSSNYESHTLYGWYESLSNENKIILNTFLNKYSNFGSINNKLIHYLLDSDYRYLILSFVDLMEYGDSCRIKNGTTNWTFRLKNMIELDKKLENYFTKEEIKKGENEQ